MFLTLPIRTLELLFSSYAVHLYHLYHVYSFKPLHFKLNFLKSYVIRLRIILTPTLLHPNIKIQIFEVYEVSTSFDNGDYNWSEIILRCE